MKVLIILPNNSAGGAEHYLKMIASHFSKEEVSIYLFHHIPVNFWTDLPPNHKLYKLSNKSKLIGLCCFIFKMLFKKESYDVIFTSHLYINSLVGILLSLKIIKAKKFISRESTSVFLRYKGIKLYIYKLAYYLGYKNMDLLICQTDSMKNQLSKHFPLILKRTRVETIPNPIDLNLITSESNKEIDFKIESDYVVSAGRLIEEKGYDILINVFSKIKLKNPSLKLVILGHGHLKEPLFNQAKLLHLEKDIIFEGYVKNVYPYFKKAKLCVVASRIEGFPNVLLQMMTQNNNVVSTKCAGGIDEIPGIITAETHNEESLLNAVQLALSNYDNYKNREKFDEYLKHRDINAFVTKVLKL